jgi:hypothetical protein
VPSPRSPESCRRSLLKSWWNFHAKLSHESAGYRATGRPQLLLLGDSIFEQWRASTYGMYMASNAAAYANVSQISSLFRHSWGMPYISAISSDQTQHLLWRLRHGCLPHSMASDPNLAIVVLIGTNNLRRDGAQITARAIVAVIHELLQRSQARWLALLGLLPRSDGDEFEPRSSGRLRALCPSCLRACCNATAAMPAAAPYARAPAHATGVMDDVHVVNDILRRDIMTMSSNMRPHGMRVIEYVACGTSMLASQDGSLDPKLRHDAVHPNPLGHERLATCLSNTLDRFLNP